MTYISTGDMAQSYQLRRHNAALKDHMTRLGTELTTGMRTDIAGAVRGDYKALAGIDHSLALLDGFKSATDEAALFAGGLQTVFETVDDLASGLAPGLLSAGTSGGVQHVAVATMDARQRFHSTIAALNSQIADRFLLSGMATDQRPLSDSQEILDALMAAAAGQTTAAGVISAVSGWFDAPPGGGGFLDLAYHGAASVSPVQIGPSDRVAPDATAADAALVGVMKGMGLAALVAEGVLPGDATAHAAIARSAGELLFGAASPMASLRAETGSAEARIAAVSARNGAEASALRIARTGLAAADPYDTATALEAVQTQIETLYAVTARLSRLSLAEYLR